MALCASPKALRPLESTRGTWVRDIECTKVLGHIEEFLDFELAKDSCSLVTEHLKHCGFCNDHAYFARQVRDIVARKCRQDPPTELEVRIRASLTGAVEQPPP